MGTLDDARETVTALTRRLAELERENAALRERLDAVWAPGARPTGDGAAHWAEARAGIWQLDLDAGEWWLSRGAKHLYGFDPDGPTPSNDALRSRIHPDDREATTDAIRRLRASGDHRDAHSYRLCFEDGAVRHVVSIGHERIEGSSGGRVVTGVVFDLTQQKRTEAALAAELAHLEQLERVNAVLRRHAAHERGHRELLGDVLAAIRRTLGADRAFAVAFDPDDHHTLRLIADDAGPDWPMPSDAAQGRIRVREGTRDLLARLPRDHTPFVVDSPGGPPVSEVAARFDARSVLAIDITPKLDGPRWAIALHQCAFARRWTEADVRLFAAIGARVTEALAASFALSALRRSEARLRSVMDAIPDAMFVLDRAGVCRHVYTHAPALRELDEALIGRPITETWRLAAGDDLLAVVHAAIDRGDVVHHDYALVVGGTTRWFSARIGPLGPASDPQVIWLARDVTNERLLARQVRARQKLESLGVLAGGVAHDFNNLLVAVLGNAELLIEAHRPDAPAETLEVLGEIVAAARSGHGLCQKLLSYAGRERLEVRRVALAEVVHDAVALSHLSAEVAADVRVEVADGAPWVMADPAQLRQAIVQLVVNAAEALTAPDGIVRVRAGERRLTEDDLASVVAAERLAPGPYALVEVSDDGHGVDAEARARIFDPFFTTRFIGRGLGLPAALGILQAHGGGIGVESAPGRGATFRLLLPLERHAGTATRATDAPNPAIGAPRTRGAVLVADDDLNVRRLLDRALARAGFEPIMAERGHLALERFDAHEGLVCAAVIDLSMPDMHGSAVFAALRRRDPGLPILVISGYDAEEIGADLLADGATAYLAKPFVPSELVAEVRALVEDDA